MKSMNIKIRKYKNCVIIVSFILDLSLVFGGRDILYSQEYITGIGDRLLVSFWQQPDLNTTVTINQKGEIDLPVIGSINASGMTISQLSNKIVEEMTIYNPNITQARIEVLSYENNKIFVTGSVLTPGKYTFELIPNLWAVILEAGGPSPNAFLNQVRITRGEIGREENAYNEIVNLERNLNEGNFDKLPKLYPGDNVYIPGLTIALGQGGQGGGAQANQGIALSRMGLQNIYIFGQVNTPGIFPIDNKMNILRAIVLAGGSTPTADLGKVQIVSQIGSYPTVVTLNLEKFISRGEISSILVNPGDTIYIPQKLSILTGPAGTFFNQFFRIVGAAVASVLLFDLLQF